MAAQALIVFVQGPNSDVGGRALVGTLSDGPVTVSNSNNTDVASWGIELLEAPPGSALAAGSLGAGVSSTPVALFTPDVPGSYRIRLTVYGSSGNTDSDIRNFAVPLPKKKIILPPYQKNPDPLPLPSSGLPTAKPEEMNFEGQARGYAGDNDPDRKLLHQALQIVDDVISLPDLDEAEDGDVLVVRVHDYDEPIALGFDGVRGWVLDSNYGEDGAPALSPIDIEQNRTVGYFDSATTTDRFEGMVLDSTGFWIAVTDTGATDTYLQKFNIINETFGPRYLVHTTAARGIAYGSVSGTPFIWLLSADQLTRVVPTTPAGPYTSVAVDDAVDVLFDETGVHYGDGLPRVWVASVGLPGLERITSAPAIDASVTMTDVTVRGMTQTSAGIFVVGIDDAVSQATVYRVAFNPAAVAASNNSINSVYSIGGGGDVFDITYDAANNKLFVWGVNGAGQGVIARVNPTSLDVESSAVLSAGVDVASTSALPRIEAFRGSIWVPVMIPAGVGRVVRVNPTTLSIVSQPPGFKEAVFDPTAGGGATLSNSTPQNIGTADAGVAAEASRADHVHAIANGTLTPAQLADQTPGFFGRSAAGLGAPSWLTPTLARSLTDGVIKVCTLEQFGAVGDGVTSDQAALTAAIAALLAGTYRALRLGAKTYLVTGGVQLPAGCSIFGEGMSSILKTATNSTLIQVLGFGCTLSSFVIEGNDGTVDQIGILGGSIGVANSCPNDLQVRDVYIRDTGWGLRTTELADVTGGDAGQGPNIVGVVCKSCTLGGFWIGSEYTKLTGVEAQLCGLGDATRPGFKIDAGNVTLTGFSASNCGLGVHVTAAGNGAHGLVSSGTVNHCDLSIRVDNITAGMHFVNVDTFGGTLWLIGSQGVVFVGGIMAADAYLFEGSLNTRFVYPTLNTPNPPCFDNYNGAPSSTVWIEPRLYNGDVPAFAAARIHLQYTFPSDANQTLTLQQSEAEILDIQAGVILATRDITSTRKPALSERRYVINRTAQIVNFGFTTGTKVAIPAGGKSLIGADGTNAIELLAGSAMENPWTEAGTIALRPDGVGADAHIFKEKWATFNAPGAVPVRVGAYHTGVAPYDTNAAIYFGGSPGTTNYGFLGSQTQVILNCPDTSGNIYLEIGGAPAMRVNNSGGTSTLFGFYDNTDTTNYAIQLTANRTGDSGFSSGTGGNGLFFAAQATGYVSFRLAGDNFLVIDKSSTDSRFSFNTASGGSGLVLHVTAAGVPGFKVGAARWNLVDYGGGLSAWESPGGGAYIRAPSGGNAQIASIAGVAEVHGATGVEVKSTSASAPIDIRAQGPIGIRANGDAADTFALTYVGGTSKITSGSNPMDISSTGSNVVIDAGGNIAYLQGVNGVTLASGASVVNVYHRSNGIDRFRFRFPADVAIAATPSVYTTLLTLAISGAAGARPTTIKGIMHAWSAAGLTVRQSFEVTMRPNGGTGAMVGTATIDTPEGDVLGTLEIDVSSGCRFRFFADASLAVALTGCITEIEYL